MCIHSLRTTRQPVIPTAPLFENDFGVGYASGYAPFFGVGIWCGKRMYGVMMCAMGMREEGRCLFELFVDWHPFSKSNRPVQI